MIISNNKDAVINSARGKYNLVIFYTQFSINVELYPNHAVAGALHVNPVSIRAFYGLYVYVVYIYKVYVVC